MISASGGVSTNAADVPPLTENGRTASSTFRSSRISSGVRSITISVTATPLHMA
jgi:hypothetical protein